MEISLPEEANAQHSCQLRPWHGTIQPRIWVSDNCILNFNTQPRDDLDAHNAKIRVSNNYISSICETMSPCLLAT